MEIDRAILLSSDDRTAQERQLLRETSPRDTYEIWRHEESTELDCNVRDQAPAKTPAAPQFRTAQARQWVHLLYIYYVAVKPALILLFSHDPVTAMPRHKTLRWTSSSALEGLHKDSSCRIVDRYWPGTIRPRTLLVDGVGVGLKSGTLGLNHSRPPHQRDWLKCLESVCSRKSGSFSIIKRLPMPFWRVAGLVL